MRPLDGVRVIDLTQVFMGPCAAQTLGDFGADVIKVERPGTGEISRAAISDPLGELNPVFASLNRNKRAVALDLRSPAGAQVLHRLLETADVLLSNFRPGVMEKLGLGYDSLRVLNPRLIAASGSGFGLTGPMAMKPGQDFLAQAATGMIARRTDPGSAPVPPTTATADYIAGQHLVQGILLALLARERTGQGQQVTVSLYSSMIAAQMQEATVQRMRGAELNWATTLLTGVYTTRDDAIMIVGSFSQYANPLDTFAEALGIAAFADPAFATIEAAIEAAPHLEQLLQDALNGLTATEALDSLEAAGVLCAPVRTLADALEQEQTAVNGLLLDIPVGDGELVRTISNPVQLHGTPADVHAPPPRVGEHNEAVLAELGYAADDVEILRAQGAFGRAGSVPS